MDIKDIPTSDGAERRIEHAVVTHRRHVITPAEAMLRLKFLAMLAEFRKRIRTRKAAEALRVDRLKRGKRV